MKRGRIHISFNKKLGIKKGVQKLKSSFNKLVNNMSEAFQKGMPNPLSYSASVKKEQPKQQEKEIQE